MDANNNLDNAQKKLAESLKIGGEGMQLLGDHLNETAKTHWEAAVKKTNIGLEHAGKFLGQQAGNAEQVLEAIKPEAQQLLKTIEALPKTLNDAAQNSPQIQAFINNDLPRLRNIAGDIVQGAMPTDEQMKTLNDALKQVVALGVEVPGVMRTSVAELGQLVTKGIGAVQNPDNWQEIGKQAVSTYNTGVEKAKFGYQVVQTLGEDAKRGFDTGIKSAKETYEAIAKSDRVQEVLKTMQSLQKTVQDTADNSPRVQLVRKQIQQLGKMADELRAGFTPTDEEIKTFNDALKFSAQVGQTLAGDVKRGLETGVKNAKQTYENVANSNQVKFGVQVAQTLKDDASRGIRNGAGRVARTWRAVRGFFGA